MLDRQPNHQVWTLNFTLLDCEVRVQLVNLLDSGALGPGFKSQPRCCPVRQTVHTHRASIHQAAKLVRVTRITAGLAESNGSLPVGL